MLDALMIQGTASHVGKSLVVAALCRLLARRGLRVAPFKPQNMSNNAGVAQGGEIGRAQMLQAFAAGVKPHVDMGPLLLKPLGDSVSELVLLGKVAGRLNSSEWRQMRSRYLGDVMGAFKRLKDNFDVVVVEGAGSPSEVNLREGDVANMGFALEAKVPVFLVADVERGGAIAALLGCWQCLADEERALVKGYFFNKFRGDLKLFDGAISYLNDRIPAHCLGVLPWFDSAGALPDEDSQSLPAKKLSSSSGFRGNAASARVAILRLPSISNFDEFAALKSPPFSCCYLDLADHIPAGVDVLVIPGSKNLIRDAEALHAAGWRTELAAHLRRGGRVWGVCGGYCLLSRGIHDPEGFEGPKGSYRLGLGVIDAEATLLSDKQVMEVEGVLEGASDAGSKGDKIRGYLIHRAKFSESVAHGKCLIRDKDGAAHGYVSDDGKVFASFWHGLAGNSAFRQRYLGSLGSLGARGASSALDAALGEDNAELLATLDKLADGLENNLDLSAMGIS